MDGGITLNRQKNRSEDVERLLRLKIGAMVSRPGATLADDEYAGLFEDRKDKPGAATANLAEVENSMAKATALHNEIIKLQQKITKQYLKTIN